ncbi:universal stress protein UspA [Nonlabens sp. MIC269]|uniref:universal stress protein n=1 Tax=Nonlabens TaxID=363408 RepID=UPI0007210FBB|nr:MULTISPECIES: universal stress protein [Nonlabens]ALM20870.1 universal stress protein UspA [Nonlabens sp. MIC269]ARN72409.1 universal stress protein UspA [Nonlabens tegetincola]MEE2801895.1 universal stress protein [Bacteroidota bacterium]PQJ18935.1 universal stress protein UspA [Nonlabens tegetincola]
MKKIIVPTDFSIQAENALRIAADMARENDGEVYLLHQLDLPLHLANNGSSNLPEAVFFMKLAKEKFDNLMKADFLDGVTVHGDVATGAAFSGIMDTVKRHNADIIVMGSHGADGVKNLFIGSNAEKVVRNSEIPVLIVKDRKERLDVNEFVFATDLDPNSTSALKEADNFARQTNCHLHLLYVNTPGNFLSTRDASAKMQEYLKNVNVEPKDYTIYNDQSVEEGVFNFSKDIKADVIGMATHGRRGLSHFFNGSVSEDVVNHSSLPVITFRIK